MGDIESYLRQKYDLETDDGQPMIDNRGQSSHGGMVPVMYYLRNPNLDDMQNMLLHRPYCGNPFVAPGTIGSKTRRTGGNQHDVELGLADEAAFFGENEETILEFRNTITVFKKLNLRDDASKYDHLITY